MTGRETGRPRYRLRDNYTRFFLKYVAPYSSTIRKGAFRFIGLEQLRGWDTILGLQFENLVLSNVNSLLPFLGLSNTLLLSVAPYRNSRTANARGVQIDLLLQSNRSLYIVEIKRRREIGPEVIDEVEAKAKALRSTCGKSIRTALVFEGRLSPRVEAEGFFDFVVPAERLFDA